MLFKNLGPSQDIALNIRSQLDGYSDGLALFKEMIQNADDAEANIVKICYDKRNSDLSKWNRTLFTASPKLLEAQGRAIWFYNDANFTENDFENIGKLGGETKKQAAEKVGKFGRGFCSVYNVTDLPSIISGESLAMFDPNICALKDKIDDLSNPGIRVNMNEREELTEYSDQLKPFDGIFGCDIFKKDFNFEGTLIRLPFRKSPSKISENIYNDDKEITNLIEFLYQNAHSILLFTQCVKEVHVYVLEDTEMRVLFSVKVSPIEFFKVHSFGLRNLKDQSSILRASVRALSEQRSSQIETSMMVKILVETNFENFKNHMVLIKGQEKESTWMIYSSFYSKHLKTGQKGFEHFMPCVGTATQVEMKSDRSLCLKRIKGNAFCFLPMSIESGLGYHVNCAFALSGDRLRIVEKTRDERDSLKSLWNDALIEPLVDNLFFMITDLSLKIKFNSQSELVRAFWPHNCKVGFFQGFEERYYERIRFRETKMSHFNAFTKNVDLTKYQDCVFINFYFHSENLNSLSISVMNQITKSSPTVIQLPVEHLNRLKAVEKVEAKFMDDLKFLEKLLANRDQVKNSDFGELILAFIIEMSFDSRDQLTKCGQFIKANKSLENRNRDLRLPSQLVNPLSNKHFAKFDLTELDDVYPTEMILNNKKAIFQLKKLGLISGQLPNDVVVKIAAAINVIGKRDLDKAKEVSETLLVYLKENKQKHNLKTLNDIEWVVCKQKPEDWCYEWRGSNYYGKSICHFNKCK